MSSNVCAPLNIDVSQRRWELRLAALCLLACALLPWTARMLSLPMQGLLTLAATSAAFIGFWRAGWLPAGQRVQRLMHTVGDEWHLQATEPLTTSLRADCRVYRHVLWLRFASGHALLLGPGDLSAEQFRQLRVAVRTSQPAAAGPLEGAA